jgi:hypothetical protein
MLRRWLWQIARQNLPFECHGLRLDWDGGPFRTPGKKD